MGWPHQRSVLARLALETKREIITRIEKPAQQMFRNQWKQQRHDLVAHVRGVWAKAGARMTLGQYRALGINGHLQHWVEQHIRIYEGGARAYLERFMKHAYREQYLRSTWQLDQVTPARVRIRPRRDAGAYQPVGRKRATTEQRRAVHQKIHRAAREAWADDLPSGRPDQTMQGHEQPSYEHRFSSAMKQYYKGVLTAATLGALNEWTAEATAGAVEQIRVGGRDPESLLDQLIRSQVNIAVVDAQNDVAADQKGVIVNRLWSSKDDERVCPTCEYLDGMNEEEVRAEYAWAEPGYLHPDCRCRWEDVPADWASAAGEDAVPGEDPDAMVVIDPTTGQPVASVVVSFQRWVKGVQ